VVRRRTLSQLRYRIHGGLTCAALDESVRNCNCVTHTHGGLTPAALVVRSCDGGDGLNGEGTIPQPPMVCMVRDGLRKRAVLI
jgi:hypothetical protein